MKNKTVILLTATINPGKMIYTDRIDPHLRLQDYLTAIKKYSKYKEYDFIFCENSGFNIQKIKILIQQLEFNNFEILQYEGLHYPDKLGKGYGELSIFDYVINNSYLLKNKEYLIKISGRYFIKNIGTYLHYINNNHFDIAVNLKRNLKFADSRIFVIKPFLLNQLLLYKNQIDDSKGFYLEHALAKVTLQLINDGYTWIPLPRLPYIDGIYATTDQKYKQYSYIYKNLLHLISVNEISKK